MSVIHSISKVIIVFTYILTSWLLSLSINSFTYAAENIIIPVNNTTQISIDGQFSANEWKNATTLTLDNVVQPFDNIPAPTETTVYTFASDDTLYVAFIA